MADSNMRFADCGKCGKAVSELFSYCPSCGAKAPASSSYRGSNNPAGSETLSSYTGTNHPTESARRGKGLSEIEVREVIDRETNRLLRENTSLRTTLGMPSRAEEERHGERFTEALESIFPIFCSSPKPPKGTPAREAWKAARKAFIGGGAVA